MGIADRWITLFNKPIPNVILRLVVLFGGFLSMAMSIALMRTTGLGNSPISCIPATLSYLVPLSLGTITFIMNTCFLIVQAILLRRDFQSRTAPANPLHVRVCLDDRPAFTFLRNTAHAVLP